jgi:hypothetical protein
VKPVALPKPKTVGTRPRATGAKAIG